jgi:hypothetical protein
MASASTPDGRIVTKIDGHARTLLTRHLRDLLHAKGKFDEYGKDAFLSSWSSGDPAIREPANLLVQAWDAAINDLIELLKWVHGLEIGYQAVRPLKAHEAVDGIGLADADDLIAVVRARNRHTHVYPEVAADQVFDAIVAFERILARALREANAYACLHGAAIPGVPST